MAPLQLCWCGTDAVLLQFPELLLLVGPYGDYVSWHVSHERLAMVSELDGVRLVSSSRHEMLRKVPDCLVQVRAGGWGSGAPGHQQQA